MTFYLALSNFHSRLQCPCLSFSCSELNISCFVLHRTTLPFLWEPHPTLLVLSHPFSDSLWSWWACPSGCPWPRPPCVMCPRLCHSESPENPKLVTQGLKAEAAESFQRQSPKRGFSEFSNLLSNLLSQMWPSVLPVVLTDSLFFQFLTVFGPG